MLHIAYETNYVKKDNYILYYWNNFNAFTDPFKLVTLFEIKISTTSF